MPHFNQFKNILAIGAHPDDIEVGCAGFLAKCIHNGINVNTAILSKCDNTSPDFEEGVREREYMGATKYLGIANSLIFDLPDTEFPENRMKVMEILTELQETIKPDLVLIPFLEDPHQDHTTVAHAAIRIFRRHESILQYEILRHGSYTFTPSLFVDISDYIDPVTRLITWGVYQSNNDSDDMRINYVQMNVTGSGIAGNTSLDLDKLADFAGDWLECTDPSCD